MTTNLHSSPTTAEENAFNGKAVMCHWSVSLLPAVCVRVCMFMCVYMHLCGPETFAFFHCQTYKHTPFLTNSGNAGRIDDHLLLLLYILVFYLVNLYFFSEISDLCDAPVILTDFMQS